MNTSTLQQSNTRDWPKGFGGRKIVNASTLHENSHNLMGAQQSMLVHYAKDLVLVSTNIHSMSHRWNNIMKKIKSLPHGRWAFASAEGGSQSDINMIGVYNIVFLFLIHENGEHDRIGKRMQTRQSVYILIPIQGFSSKSTPNDFGWGLSCARACPWKREWCVDDQIRS